MKSTGITRKIDELGRVVLPIELRRSLDLSERDSLEIFVDGKNVVLKKMELACVFCGSSEKMLNYKDKNICQGCLSEIKDL